jgi:hypothetical protein
MSEFNTQEEVASFVAAHGIDELRRLLGPPSLLAGRRREVALGWLQSHEAELTRRIADDDRDFVRRDVIANETAAAAAVESARHARESAKWARAAVFIALAALLVSAWPWMKELLS